MTYEETRRPAGQERAQLEELAGTYRRYTEENAPLNERKAQFYITALIALIVGVLCIVGGLMWASCGIPRIW